MFKIEEVISIEELKPYQASWDALLKRLFHADILQTYEWMLCWLNAFWQDRPIAFYFVWQGDLLTGIFPFLKDEKGDLWCKGTFPTPVNYHSGCNDFIYEGDLGGVLDSLIKHMKERGGVGTMSLKDIPGTATTLATIKEKRKENNLSIRMHPSGAPVPFIDLAGTWDSFIRSRPRRVRHELGRKRRALERKGGSLLEWRVFTLEDQVEEALEGVLTIERNSWKEEYCSSITSEVGAERFYREMAVQFVAKGWLRIYLLVLDDQPLAHIYGATYRGTYYAFKTSFDKGFSKLSPGVVLFQYALEDLFNQGMKIFDFMGGGEERWKQQLATGNRQNMNVCIFQCQRVRCQLCKSYNNTVKSFIRKHFPIFVEKKNDIIQARKKCKGIKDVGCS